MQEWRPILPGLHKPCCVKTAEAQGLEKLMACSQDPELVKFYLALEKGLFTDIAGVCPTPALYQLPV